MFKNKLKKIILILSILPSIFLTSKIYPQNKITNSNKIKPSSKIFEKNYHNSLKAASKQSSFSVSFKQEVFSILRDKITASNGILTIKKPASFRFEITSPRQEIYVSNAKSFWKYIPELKHAQHLRANSNELGFVNLLTNFSHIKKYYEVSEWTSEEAKKLKQDINTAIVKSDTPPPQNDDYVLLKLVPKGDKQQKVLYAVIQVKTGFIQELRIVQLNGNRTRLVFSQYSPKLVSDEIFEFTPPQGIAVDNM
jgi:outer membrane lipoprotein-sorting protein